MRIRELTPFQIPLRRKVDYYSGWHRQKEIRGSSATTLQQVAILQQSTHWIFRGEQNWYRQTRRYLYRPLHNCRHLAVQWQDHLHDLRGELQHG